MDIPEWSVLLWWVVTSAVTIILFWCSLGNTAPYHITQPSTDNDVQIVSPTATMATLTCSLNVTIPSSMIIIWNHNGSVRIGGVSTAGKSTTLVIEDPEPSDAGDYECVFNDDIINDGWILSRRIRLLNFITIMFLYHKIIQIQWFK